MRRKDGKFMTLHNVPVILDLGHYKLKGIVGDDPNRRADAPHALQEMSRDEWQNVVEVGRNANPDYIQVGTRFFEVGETAAVHTAHVAEGVARYRRTYYGVLMCQMIALLFEPDEIREAVVFASYPPGDRRHIDELEDSLIGHWEFHHMGRRFDFIVRQVVTYTEPMGGFWNFVIQEDELGFYDNPDYFPRRQTLVVDLGGGTMSLLPIGRNQTPDYRRAESFDVGFNDVAKQFQRELRSTQRDLMRASRHLPPDLLHEAIADGFFRGGGHEEGIDVSREVESAMAELFDQFKLAYQAVGGPAPFGQIVLTGGGSIVLGERLKRLMGHQRVFYAHEDIQQLAFANVSGGLKAYHTMLSQGAI